MNIDDQFEEFLLPVENDTQRIKNDEMISGGVLPVDSPTKRLGSILNDQHSKVPESPDMKFARKRLDCLLSTIKQLPNSTVSINEDLMLEDSPEKRPIGRPRKSEINEDRSEANPDMKTDMVLFELRGKRFGLIDGRKDSEYQLCRSWIRGKPSIDHVDECDENPPRTSFLQKLPIDFLAGREIVEMPAPMKTKNDFPVMPDRLRDTSEIRNTENFKELKIQYCNRWKAIKKSWIAHQKKRESAKYSNSILLLSKIHIPTRY